MTCLIIINAFLTKSDIILSCHDRLARLRLQQPAMLSRRGRKRRAPARFEEATPSTRSRRSATVTARSDGHNGDDDSPPAITTTSDTSVTVGSAASDTSVGSAAVDANVTVLQQQVRLMQQQMQSMHDIVSTLASVSPAPAAATELPSAVDTCAAATELPSLSTTPAGATAYPPPLTTPAGATAYPPPLTDGVHPGEIPQASNMSSFSSVPLGGLVDSKLKARIWAGQYIELDLLLGGVVDNPVLIFDIRSQQSSVQTREQPQHRINNIAQWTDAFLVFMAIYTDRFPTEVASILKYVQLMRTMAFTTKSNICLAYDRDFRKLRAHNNMPWNVLHQELFFSLTSRADYVPSVQQKMGFPQRKQPFRTGLCHAFGATGRCRKPLCPYKHACPSCGGNHSKSQCQTKQMLHPVTKPTNTGYRK